MSFRENSITEIDLSKNTALEVLIFYGNSIETLDVSKNVLLETFDHDGEFGFEAILTIKLDEKNADSYANLSFTHASDYAIMISDEIMDNVVVDTDNNNDSNNSNNNNSSNSSNESNENALNAGDGTPIVWLFVLEIISGTGICCFAKKTKTNR